MNCRSAKRVKLLDEDCGDDGVEPTDIQLKINEEYARKFEYNKKRDEIQKLESKYGKKVKPADPLDSGSPSSCDEDIGSTSTLEISETEDEDGFEVTEQVDQNIQEIISAVRSRDPRIFDPNVNWYNDSTTDSNKSRTGMLDVTQKPFYLKDFHLRNYLENKADNDTVHEKSYDENVSEARAEFLQAVQDQEGHNDVELNSFLREKLPRSEHDKQPRVKITRELVENADANPEEFLNTFFSSRGWIGDGTNTWAPLESDDDEEDARAEQFEEAYNLRFEDPEKSNQVITSHSRTIAAAVSARREKGLSKRQKARAKEKERKSRLEEEHKAELKRLRKLKLEEAEAKLAKIKESAGASQREFDVRKWAKFLADDFDDEKWGEMMSRQFNDEYYNDRDDNATGTKRVKRPKWSDDIPIDDIVGSEDNGEEMCMKMSEIRREKRRVVRNKRIERQNLEALVDSKLEVDMFQADRPDTKPLNVTSKKAGTFKYRETEPISFGLTPLEILTATDEQLNEYTGLKRLSHFRDAKKKRKDRKFMNSHRLRQWREKVFGSTRAIQCDRSLDSTS